MSMFSSLPIGGLFNAAGNIFSANQRTKNAKQQQTAIRSAIQKDSALFDLQVGQVGAQAVQQKGMRAIQAEQQMGQLNALLAETGAVGNTHAALRNQIVRDMGIDQQTITTNAQNALSQARAEFDSRLTGYQSQANGVASQSPSAVGGFLSSLSGFLPDKSGNKMTFGDLWK